MIYHDLPWITMNYHELPWFTHDLPPFFEVIWSIGTWLLDLQTLTLTQIWIHLVIWYHLTSVMHSHEPPVEVSQFDVLLRWWVWPSCWFQVFVQPKNLDVSKMMKHPGWWNLNLLFFRHVSACTCNAAHMFPGLEPIHLRLLRHMLQVAPQDQSLEGQLRLAKHQPVIDGPKSEHVRHPLPRYHLYNII